MNRLQPPDSIHLSAAGVWLQLGNADAANEELERISPAFRTHPSVLELRWLSYAEKEEWEACVHIANAVVALVPERPFGWVHRSFALHALKRTQEARAGLLPAVERFPEEALIRYNLACYDCQLNRLTEARAWLEWAFRIGNPQEFKLMALGDPDLEPLWKEIGSMCALTATAPSSEPVRRTVHCAPGENSISARTFPPARHCGSPAGSRRCSSPRLS